jgi:mRNA-degrading endonuclease RelE of RelBE toxin-antitoxin system
MAPTRTQTLTLTEAAYVLGRSRATLNKAFNSGILRTRQRKVGKAVQRLLGPAELRFLRVTDELDKDLTPTGRRRLYKALRKRPSGTYRVRLGGIELDLARIDRDLAEKVSRLHRVREGVDRRPLEAVIRGTDVPVHLIAGLARAQTADEIAQDFPSLSRRQIETAVEYAKAYPKRGRPFATQSLKRALGKLAKLGVFDERENSRDRSPRKIP